MKKSVFLFAMLWILLCTAGCDVNNTKKANSWDEIGYIECTAEQKNAQACNLILYPVCGNDWVTYDNECIACTTHWVKWYVLWTCEPECDDDSWVCSVNTKNTEEDEEENTSNTQEIWLELIVVDPEA